MLFVRPATPGDLPALAEAARHLDSVNLPHDEGKLRESIVRSQRSFAAVAGGDAAAKTPAPTAHGDDDGEFVFVMVEPGADGRERVVGSSMIFARHGSRRAPHSFFDVFDDERYSETLDRHIRHKVLRLGYNYEGLTELGGLVLLPSHRGHPERLGKSLVFVRFLYIALHRAHFRDQMVAELMPPLEADGTSLLWEALGRHFTGLSYQDADRLSRANKEFIRALFPQDPIYATLLPPGAQAMIGKVGPHTRGVERMLTEAGFRYANRIDPFDGGPHFHARTDELAPIVRTRRVPIAAVGPIPPRTPSVRAEAVAISSDGDWEGPALIARLTVPPPHFVAVRAQVALRAGALLLPAGAAATLRAGVGDTVGVLPL
jgi:arginine N-succinyltransferase